MEGMRICYVTVDVVVPHFRGASTHVYEVAKHLTQLGHEVHVISRRSDCLQSDYDVLDGIHVHRIYRGMMAPLPFSSYQQFEGGAGKDQGLVQKLYEHYLFTIYAFYAGLVASSIITKYKIEAIIERETSFGAGAIASVITKKPMILEVIGPRYSKLSHKRSKKILVYTKSMIRYPTSPKKIVYVTGAADMTNFKPNSTGRKLVREKYGLKDSVVIGYVGTFAKWHGLEELIEASAKVLEQFSDARFLMVGPYFQYAKETAQKRGISESYVFTGPVFYSDVPDYINAADILVAPYNPVRWELRRKYGMTSPLKVFEYMACAKPIITTSVTPIDQVVQNEKTGVLVPPGDPMALAEAIINLIEKPELRERIGKAARQEVRNHYSWKAFSCRLEKILDEVLRT